MSLNDAKTRVDAITASVEKLNAALVQTVSLGAGFRPDMPLHFPTGETSLDFTPALTAGGYTSGNTRGHGGGGPGGRSGGYSGSSVSSEGGGGINNVGPGSGLPGAPSYAYTFATAGSTSAIANAVSKGIQEGFAKVADKAGIGISDAILRRAMR